jgi:nitrite reductase/ring-hydroxylating ferredoxin subunit
MTVEELQQLVNKTVDASISAMKKPCPHCGAALTSKKLAKDRNTAVVTETFFREMYTPEQLKPLGRPEDLFR